MGDPSPENGDVLAPISPPTRPGRGGRREGAGGKPKYLGVRAQKTLKTLTTRRLDGRSALAIAVRHFKADVRRDRGGDLTRAQEVLLEAAAQKWIILQALGDYIGRQRTLMTKTKDVIPAVRQFMVVSESLERTLERLGLDRRAVEGPSLDEFIRKRERSAGTLPLNPPNPPSEQKNLVVPTDSEVGS